MAASCFYRLQFAVKQFYFAVKKFYFAVNIFTLPPSIRSRRFRAPKTEVFKYTLQGGDLVKTKMYCIRLDRRKRWFSNMMKSCLGAKLFLPIQKYVRMQILLNTQKITSFFENTRLQMDGQIQCNNSKTLRVDADFFKYGGKKFPATC